MSVAPRCGTVVKQLYALKTLELKMAPHLFLEPFLPLLKDWLHGPAPVHGIWQNLQKRINTTPLIINS